MESKRCNVLLFGRLFTKNSLSKILEGRVSPARHGILFVGAVIDCETRLGGKVSIMRSHSTYSDLLSSLLGYKSNEMTSIVQIRNLRRKAMESKQLTKGMLEEACETGMDTSKFI